MILPRAPRLKASVQSSCKAATLGFFLLLAAACGGGAGGPGPLRDGAANDTAGDGRDGGGPSATGGSGGKAGSQGGADAASRDLGADAEGGAGATKDAGQEKAAPDAAKDAAAETSPEAGAPDRPFTDGPATDVPMDRPTASDGGADVTSVDAASTETGTGGADGPAFCPADAGTTDSDGGAMLGRLGDPCADSGLLACNGAAQAITLVCSGGHWQSLSTCADNQRCDRRQGVCAPLVTACTGRAPGTSSCEGDVQVTCGPDLVTVSRTPCCGLCRNGACQGAYCGDGKVSPGEECDDGNQNAGDGCEPGCKKASIQQIVAGEQHTCVLLTGGAVRCWGSNATGQLGIGASTDFSSRKPYLIPLVPLDRAAIALAAGRAHTCALLADGSLRCWGANNAGQLGLGHTRTVGDNEQPTAENAGVALGETISEVSAGGDVTCVITARSKVRCWGDNAFGQLGLGHKRTIGDDELPTELATTVTLDAKPIHLAVGGRHTCAALEGDLTRCWGHNAATELGIIGTDDIGDDELPTAVPADDWSAWGHIGTISAGRTRTFIWFADGSGGHGWGDNDDRGLGVPWLGNTPDRLPTKLGGVSFQAPMLALQAGGYHACTALQNHQFRCWGINDHAQLGLPFTYTVGPNELVSDVAIVDFGKDAQGFALHAKAMGLGTFHMCALISNGALKCWGENAAGQLGLGYASSGQSPTYVGGTASTTPALLPEVQVFATSP